MANYEQPGFFERRRLRKLEKERQRQSKEYRRRLKAEAKFEKAAERERQAKERYITAEDRVEKDYERRRLRQVRVRGSRRSKPHRRARPHRGSSAAKVQSRGADRYVR